MIVRDVEIMDRIISLVSKHVTRNEARMRTNLTSHPSNEVWWRQLQSPYFFKEEQSTSGRKLVFIINTSAKLIRSSLITCRVSETSHLWTDFKTRPNQYYMLRGLKQAADQAICSLLSLLCFPSSPSFPSTLFLPLYSFPSIPEEWRTRTKHAGVTSAIEVIPGFKSSEEEATFTWRYFPHCTYTLSLRDVFD